MRRIGHRTIGWGVLGYRGEMVLVRRLAGVVVIAVVVAAFAVVAAVGLVPLVTGASTYTVLTGSMRPALPVGTVVVVRPTPVEQIAVGEVVTFLAHDPGTSATRVVTHRVIGIDPGPVLRTRGDANDAPDPGGTVAADVRGVLWYSVPWVGRIPSTSWLLVAGGVLLSAGGRERADARPSRASAAAGAPQAVISRPRRVALAHTVWCARTVRDMCASPARCAWAPRRSGRARRRGRRRWCAPRGPRGCRRRCGWSSRRGRGGSRRCRPR